MINVQLFKFLSFIIIITLAINIGLDLSTNQIVLVNILMQIGLIALLSSFLFKAEAVSNQQFKLSSAQSRWLSKIGISLCGSSFMIQAIMF